jgi:hypothetical protein
MDIKLIIIIIVIVIAMILLFVTYNKISGGIGVYSRMTKLRNNNWKVHGAPKLKKKYELPRMRDAVFDVLKSNRTKTDNGDAIIKYLVYIYFILNDFKVLGELTDKNEVFEPFGEYKKKKTIYEIGNIIQNERTNSFITVEVNENFDNYHWFKSAISDVQNIIMIQQYQGIFTEIFKGSIQLNNKGTEYKDYRTTSHKDTEDKINETGLGTFFNNIINMYKTRQFNPYCYYIFHFDLLKQEYYKPFEIKIFDYNNGIVNLPIKTIALEILQRYQYVYGNPLGLKSAPNITTFLGLFKANTHTDFMNMLKTPTLTDAQFINTVKTCGKFIYPDGVIYGPIESNPEYKEKMIVLFDQDLEERMSEIKQELDRTRKSRRRAREIMQNIHERKARHEQLRKIREKIREQELLHKAHGIY